MMNISIASQSCTKCGKCVRVCPGKVFDQPSAKAEVIVALPEMCIVCGHCAAVCPQSAIQHEAFPAEKVHSIDYSLYPSAEQLMLLIKGRRSNRAFSTKTIPQETLTQIIEAGHRAPTASNQQQVRFKLITDKEPIQQVSSFTLNTFISMVRPLNNPIGRFLAKHLIPSIYRYLPLFDKMKAKFEQGDDLILRRATALLFIYTPTSSNFGSEDANLAYQNSSLMAEVLGVGHFYTGFVIRASQQKKGSLEKMLGIEGRIRAGMAMGMVAFRYPNYIDKKECEAL